MPYYPVENTHKAVFPGAGKFHMPIIKPETDIRIDKLEWIPFDKIQKTKPSDRAGQMWWEEERKRRKESAKHEK